MIFDSTDYGDLDQEIEDEEDVIEQPEPKHTYPGPNFEPDYFLEMEYEDRFRSDLDD